VDDAGIVNTRLTIQATPYLRLNVDRDNIYAAGAFRFVWLWYGIEFSAHSTPIFAASSFCVNPAAIPKAIIRMIYFKYHSCLIMKTQIGRWGNSLGIRIPKYIAEELALTVNGEVECRLENGVMMVYPVNKYGKYTLEQLIAAELEDDPEVNWGQAVGDEEW
jgi:antitoxin MazE